MTSTDDSDEPRDDEYVTTFDPEDDRPSEVIVTAVAAIRGAEPAALSPLYDAVDPAALNALFEHAQRVAASGCHRVWFTYEGLDVGIRTDGEIRIRDATGAS
ncbi:HalOD1 output domain-containing protein [Natrinema salifodinae]|uniref:Halobacterial output domain-containing protein n=1 Tax=Natrinema salifodinae TaxID=1202768 RepID=A0A1I0QKZ9_9EURY|nr:HalOD1 output domain-containing protein [Natrinema salifodinae]SEW27389.1 hypothetical protein SAMN05216285_3672 [Natrinema salifodinae]